jgi:hypothetical protein
MLEVNPATWLRPKKESAEADRRRVLAFTREWDPFDWTKQLDSPSAAATAGSAPASSA